MFMEVEWGGGSRQTAASAFRDQYTPEGTHPCWGRTEFSVSFDSPGRDRVTFAANCVIHDGAIEHQIMVGFTVKYERPRVPSTD